MKRNEMSDKYKNRVANFLKEMAEGPVQLIDYYEPSKTKLRDLISFKGKDHMVFKAPRTDKDIKQEMSDMCAMLDTTPPNKAEIHAWNMRPRDK